MRFVFLFVFFFSASVFAKGTSVADLAAQLGTIAATGVREYPLVGDSEKQLLFSLLDQMANIQEDTEIYVNYPSIELSNEYVYGTTDAKNFSDLITGAIYFMDEDASEGEAVYSQSMRVQVEEILAQLKKQNVIYSWNPSGDIVCGTTLTTPVIIDPQTKKAYEFNFFKIEGC